MSTITELAFPRLFDGVLELNRLAFTVFGVDVYWYGILIAVGFGLALLYAFVRIKTFGLNADRAIDVIMLATIGGIIGARLYFVAFQWDYYSQNLDKLFSTREGGMAIYGGVIGAFVVGALVCKWRKVKIAPMMDMAASGFLLGQAIGRWGNFVNVEAFGGLTDAPWGMASPRVLSYLTNPAQASVLRMMDINLDGVTNWQQVTVHPTFFYESMWCLLGFLLVALYTKHRKFDGEITLFYAAWYGAGRAVIEGFRTDSLMIAGTNLRVSQIFAALCVIVAVAIWVVIRIKRKNDPGFAPLYCTTEESALALSGELYKKTTPQAPDKQAVEQETAQAPQTETDATDETPKEEK